VPTESAAAGDTFSAAAASAAAAAAAAASNVSGAESVQHTAILIVPVPAVVAAVFADNEPALRATPVKHR